MVRLINKLKGNNMNKLAVAVLAMSVLGGVGVANAAAGDSTFSVGYAQIHSKGLKKEVNATRDAVNAVSDAVYTFAGPLPADVFSADAGKYKEPKGLNVKYRYEFDDRWGVIGSFTWARSKTSAYIQLDDPDSNTFANASGSAKGNYFSIMAGPSLRANDYFSTYVMAGATFARVKYSGNLSYDLSAYGLGSGSESASDSHNKSSFAYSAGIQLNPIKNIAIDLAYEGSGSGDWKTNGFIMGIGYKF